MSVSKKWTTVTPLARCLWLSVLLFPSYLYALSCTPIVVQNDKLTRTIQEPVYIVFHNTSAHNLYVTHSRAKDESSLLEPGRWSMLLLAQPKLTLHCVESRPGHEQYVNCQSALVICQLPTKQTQPETETKWLTENVVEPMLPLATETNSPPPA